MPYWFWNSGILIYVNPQNIIFAHTLFTGLELSLKKKSPRIGSRKPVLFLHNYQSVHNICIFNHLGTSLQ